MPRKRITIQTPTRWPGKLTGRRMICDYLDISRNTMYHWMRRYRLPVAHLPNGVVFSSTYLLDQWLAEAIETELSDVRDRTGWRQQTYGLHSGIRLAHER